jgi:hypothetical protein
MKTNARESARSKSWELIFNGVYDAYQESIRIAEAIKKAAANTEKNGQAGG